MGALADSLASSGLVKQTVLYSATLGAATSVIDITSIVQIAKASIKIEFRGFTTDTASGSRDLNLLMGSGSIDTTVGNYYSRRHAGYATGSSSNATVSDAGDSLTIGGVPKTGLTYPGMITATIFDYSSSGVWSCWESENSFGGDYWSLAFYLVERRAHYWENTAAIDTLRFEMSTGDIEAGSTLKVWIEEV
jgi:hypothetical protein